MNGQGCKNTDVEIWREVPGDYYSPSIHVTEHGDIGISVGGRVLVAPITRWFAAGVIAFCVKEEDMPRVTIKKEDLQEELRTLIDALEEAIPGIRDSYDANGIEFLIGEILCWAWDDAKRCLDEERATVDLPGPSTPLRIES